MHYFDNFNYQEIHLQMLNILIFRAIKVSSCFIIIYVMPDQ